NPPDLIVIASPPDPPDRNTRSTSRSVELSELLRPKPQPKKGTVFEHHEPMEIHPDPMRETLDEEQDVEDLLVNISGRSQAIEDSLQTRTRIILQFGMQETVVLVNPEQQPRTPAANSQSQFWRGSTSSEESFPITGTKASAAKKIIETEEKRTPYRPPVGLRQRF
ncbi:hypothetical protein H2248_007048, partial [Termitomyces sp. 'cryptogamus']